MRNSAEKKTMLREYIAAHKHDVICKRTSTRSRANGIVALMDIDEPIISRINDIAQGGVSFLHGEPLHLPTNEIRMDILIFDVQTNVEYFMSHVKGRIKSTECIADPQGNLPILHFSVEFLELEALHRNVLKAYFDEVSP
jgi:hypothetical protein